jgi:DNA-directed RNA polymerase subunit RPC12/RpoP
MADIRFRCSGCNAKLKISDDAAGSEVPCPFCKKSLRVPPSSELLEIRPFEYPPDVLSIDMKFLCPECRAKLSIEISEAGGRALCPACGKSIRAPALPPPLRPAMRAQGGGGAERPAGSRGPAMLTPDEVAYLTATEKPVTVEARK